MVRVDDAGGQGGGQRVEDVGAVHAVHAVPAAGIGGQDRANDSAVHAAILRARPDLRADVGERLAKAHALELAQAVGVNEDAGADFAEDGRLFVDVHLEAALQQGVRRCKSANAAADDGRPQRARFRSHAVHPSPPSFLPRAVAAGPSVASWISTQWRRGGSGIFNAGDGRAMAK